MFMQAYSAIWGSTFIDKKLHLYHTFFSAIFSMSCEFLVFSVYGNLPSELIFLFTQLYTVFITLFIGTLNVSSFLQVCLISQFGYFTTFTFTPFYIFLHTLTSCPTSESSSKELNLSCKLNQT